MKAIQTWIPYRNPNEFILNKDEAYMIMLSSLLLKKHYGSVTLYTNDIQKEWFERIGFEYEYDTKALEDDKGDVFSIPKLNIIKSISEPFVHYDLDTYVFEKPNLNRKSPYIFSHPDVEFASSRLEKFMESPEDVIRSYDFKLIYDTYLEFYLQNKNTLDKIDGFPDNEIKLSEIPNMNIIAVTDNLDIYKKTIDDVLAIYEILKPKFKEKRIHATFLEQFLINIYLKKNNVEYKKLVEDYTNGQIKVEDSPYLFSGIPVVIENENLDIWPLKFINSQYCTKCRQEHKFTKEFKTLDDLKNDFNYDFLSYYHLGGDKPFPLVHALTINHIINNFGEEYVTKIHNFWKELLQDKNYVSLGEELYEKITGNPIFTNSIKKSVI